ncbi:hypothetical protein WJS89_05595 [Sphingomicrobium sp. XHP0235]
MALASLIFWSGDLFVAAAIPCMVFAIIANVFRYSLEWAIAQAAGTGGE